jgi:hypothetical protein
LTIKYLRRESFLSIYPTSLVKDRDHRGSMISRSSPIELRS